MKNHHARQQGSALVIVLALSSALFLIMQAATTQVYTMDRQLEFMEEKHNRNFRQRHPDMAVESANSEQTGKERKHSSHE